MITLSGSGKGPIKDDIKDGHRYSSDKINHLSSVSKSLRKVLYTCLWPSNGLNFILTACPIIFFAFSCQCNICSIYIELPKSSDKEDTQIHDDTTMNNINDNNHLESTNICNTTISEATSSPNKFVNSKKLTKEKQKCSEARLK